MSFTTLRERSRDVQDGTERHVWGKKEYVQGGGSIMRARGTDSEDKEGEVINGGYDFNVKENFNTEVFALASSSDTTLKMMMQTIPKDKQRRWMEGHGGVQHPTDNTFALDISDDLAHITKPKFAAGDKGEFEVKNKEAYFRNEKVIIDKQLVVNELIRTPMIVSGKEKIPDFHGSKEAPVSGNQGGQQFANTETGFATERDTSEKGTMHGFVIDFGNF